MDYRMSGCPSSLDLVLKAFMNSRDFNDIKNKNWVAICRLVPGSSPRQVAKRYEELQQLNINHYSGDFSASTAAMITKPLSLQSKTTNQDTESARCDSKSGSVSARPKATNTGIKLDRPVPPIENKLPPTSDNSDQGPMMVIHVCDEAKNLKQDFQCPRDLLIREMQYFAEYLSTDAHRWEEVDISVHCDVLIFDWLMKYVKRDRNKSEGSVMLEPNNVISILISSDFLKMDSLVQKCIEFCHSNMNAIVATPCNMNCINDALVSRIAYLFNHNELDDLRDRKDKFKSKLFAKKVEKLFDGDTVNHCSPETAATLFKCSMCPKLLTTSLQSKVNCVDSRMTIDQQGGLIYSHIRDKKWDVNDFLLDLKKQLKSWREVYWRLWGTVNYLFCSCCNKTFQCIELGHCKFHPNDPVFPSSTGSSMQGKYPCCGLNTLRFNPIQSSTGCQTRDHIVCNDETKHTVYKDLLLHKDIIDVPYIQPVTNSSEDVLNVFADEEVARGLRKCEPSAPKLSQGAATDLSKSQVSNVQPRLQPLTIERQISFEDETGMGESDDEIGDDESPSAGKHVKKSRVIRKSKVTVDPQAILLDAPDFRTGLGKNNKWDSNKPNRWNQDSQREEDDLRMKEIVNYLTKLRLTNEKLEKMKQKEYSGGLYSKLEAQWKSANITNKPALSQIRNKPRLGQVRNSLT